MQANEHLCSKSPQIAFCRHYESCQAQLNDSLVAELSAHQDSAYQVVNWAQKLPIKVCKIICNYDL